MSHDAVGGREGRSRAPAERRPQHARFLQSLDRVDRAVQAATDLEQMMRNVLDEVLAIFDCDRAYLLYPCNPDSPTWMPRMERTRPEYPGALAVGLEIPTRPEKAAAMRICLAAPGPVTFGPEADHPIAPRAEAIFGIKSFVAMALRTTSGDAWEFGLQQCSRPRVWTPEEVRLVEEIGRRLCDGLSNLLARRDLLATERRLRLALQASRTGVFDVDLESGAGAWTAETATIWGLATDLGGDFLAHCWSHLHPDDDARIRAEFATAVAGGSEHEMEFRVVRPDGTTRWVRWRGQVVPNPDGHGRRVLGVNVDITERSRDQEEIRNLNREFERQVVQYRMLLDQASDAILVTDGDRHYVDVNVAACELLGYTREELLNLSIPDITTPEDNPGQLERFNKMRAGETMLSERCLRRKDGSLVLAELNSRQLPDGRFQAIVRDITSRKRLEEEQVRLATAVEQANEAIVITDPSATIVYVNPAFERVSGYSRAELLGANSRILRSGQHSAAFYAAMWSALLEGETWHGTLINRRKDGALFEEDATITPIRDPGGTVVSYVGVKRDVTRELALEAQLRESQKMEAIGQLAGGIAHDFNNLITAIRGYSELIRESLPQEASQREDVDQVLLAADRAANLTKQLLAFSRRQVLQPRIVAPAEIVEGVAPMLRRLLGENIEVVTLASPDLGRIRVDPSKLEQIIVNLAVNARDAMPGGGRLVIETANAELEGESEPGYADVTPGSYVVLRVTDTGHGMDQETRAHAFEPFFTTKEQGSGTGMGLAMVYGIVRQSGGEIHLRSELGHGTTFEIYLPRVHDEPIAAPRASEVMAVPRGSETILLVEDEESVRSLARRALEELGYTVIAAADGVEAGALATHATRPIDLLVTDVVMPRMGGRQLAGQLRAARPQLNVLFISGFAGNAGLDLTAPGAFVLTKPFSREELGRAVRRALEAAG